MELEDNEEAENIKNAILLKPVQIKIVRECYGENDLEVYYFFFTFIPVSNSSY